MRNPSDNRYLVLTLAVLCAATSFSTARAQMLNWSTYTAPAYAEIRDVAFGNNRYVAVGDVNAMCYWNGSAWVNGKLPPGLDCDLKTVAYAFGNFYAGGKNRVSQKGVFLISADGVNWADISSQFNPPYLSYSDLRQIFHLCAGLIGGVPVLTATYENSDGYYYIGYTLNGAVWANSSSSGGLNPLSDGQFIYHLDKYYANDTYANWVQLKWNTQSTPAYLSSSSTYLPDDVGAYARGNGVFVGVGAGMKLVYGSRADTYVQGGWIYSTSPAVADYKGVAFGRDMFVAVGTAGTIVVSYDLGRRWHKITVPIGQVTLNGIRFVGDKFIAYGGGRIIMGTPVNRRNWTASPLPNGTVNINDIASNGTLLVAVGNNGQILYSSLGLSWTKAIPMTSQTLNRVDYDGTTKAFYATGAGGTLLRSTNGANWTVTTTGLSGNLRGVGRSAGKLVAGCDTSGVFISSPNGTQWTTVTGASALNFGRTVSDTGAGQIFAYGAAGRVARSVDGGNVWQGLPTPSSLATLTDMTVYNASVYLAGSTGAIYRTSQSSPGTWTTTDTRTSLAFYGLPRNAQAALQIAAVGQMGSVYSEPSTGVWRLEIINSGSPTLRAVIKHGGRWIVVGSLGASGYVSTTAQN